MKEYESEKKLIISRKQYNDLFYRFIRESKNFEQINYYYDTQTEIFRKRGITCRVRQKEDILVGTIKEHEIGSERSLERHFKLGCLPYKMIIDNEEVSLKGQLITFRTECELFDSMTLMLDKNIYLGTVDYELELEYQKDREDEVIRYIQTLTDVLGDIDKLFSPDSKSERFFKRLNFVQTINCI